MVNRSAPLAWTAGAVEMVGACGIDDVLKWLLYGVHSFIHLFSSMLLHMQHWTYPFVYYKIYSMCTEFQNIDIYKVFITW